MARGGSKGGRDKGYVFTSHVFFNYVFDVYNFYIILNLFDNNKPYALRRIIENVQTKSIIFGKVSYSELGSQN